MNRIPLLVLYAGGSFLILTIILYTGTWIFAYLEQAGHEPHKKEKQENIQPVKFTKDDLPDLLRDLNPGLLHDKNYSLIKEGLKLTVEASLDTALQDYITDLLRRSLTHQAAVVVIRPDSGQILAMASYENDGEGGKENLCLKADFPAASLFKIISAAAAIEARGFTPERTLEFQGRKYTLYKKQLRQEKGGSTTKISFLKAFSKSINPVFGKIGIYDLGRKLMTEYANKFLFNQPIPFDLPLDISNIDVPDDDFGLAEISSGFNKRTLISPLHAVLITAAVANNGTMMEPWLVKSVKDQSDKTFYRVTPVKLANPIKENTAKKLRILMDDTVLNGTCRKAFRTLQRKKTFKDIELGAKTGTINDKLDQYKYDWLTAYALPGDNNGGICITILAIHGKKLGFRARDIARDIINYYFTS